MFRPRIIPVLLLKNRSLVKSVKFNNHKYIGDPINAVRIFNDFKADELVFLDITATKEDRLIPVDFVKKVGGEANMPFSIGGGIKSLENIRKILESGAEKVVINSATFNNFQFIEEAAKSFGSSTITICLDIKKKLWGNQQVWIKNGTIPTGNSPVEYAKFIENSGAGEIIIQSIEKDGTMTGYDIPLIKSISESVSIPVVALGGAGSIADLKKANIEGFANGLAAGSLFVYHGSGKGVLINYPEPNELKMIFR